MLILSSSYESQQMLASTSQHTEALPKPIQCPPCNARSPPQASEAISLPNAPHPATSTCVPPPTHRDVDWCRNDLQTAALADHSRCPFSIAPRFANMSSTLTTAGASPVEGGAEGSTGPHESAPSLRGGSDSGANSANTVAGSNDSDSGSLQDVGSDDGAGSSSTTNRSNPTAANEDTRGASGGSDGTASVRDDMEPANVLASMSRAPVDDRCGATCNLARLLESASHLCAICVLPQHQRKPRGFNRRHERVGIYALGL